MNAKILLVILILTSSFPSKLLATATLGDDGFINASRQISRVLGLPGQIDYTRKEFRDPCKKNMHYNELKSILLENINGCLISEKYSIEIRLEANMIYVVGRYNITSMLYIIKFTEHGMMQSVNYIKTVDSAKGESFGRECNISNLKNNNHYEKLYDKFEYILKNNENASLENSKICSLFGKMSIDEVLKHTTGRLKHLGLSNDMCFDIQFETKRLYFSAWYVDQNDIKYNIGMLFTTSSNNSHIDIKCYQSESTWHGPKKTKP